MCSVKWAKTHVVSKTLYSQKLWLWAFCSDFVLRLTIFTRAVWLRFINVASILNSENYAIRLINLCHKTLTLLWRSVSTNLTRLLLTKLGTNLCTVATQSQDLRVLSRSEPQNTRQLLKLLSMLWEIRQMAIVKPPPFCLHILQKMKRMEKKCACITVVRS